MCGWIYIYMCLEHVYMHICNEYIRICIYALPSVHIHCLLYMCIYIAYCPYGIYHRKHKIDAKGNPMQKDS